MANRLVELCRQGKYAEAHQELYSDHAKSIEPAGGMSGEVQGREALQHKGQQWEAMVEDIKSAEVSDAVVAEDVAGEGAHDQIEEGAAVGQEKGALVLDDGPLKG